MSGGDGDLGALVTAIGRFAGYTAQRSPEAERIREQLSEGARFRVVWDGATHTVRVTIVSADGTRRTIAAFVRGAEAWHAVPTAPREKVSTT